MGAVLRRGEVTADTWSHCSQSPRALSLKKWQEPTTWQVDSDAHQDYSEQDVPSLVDHILLGSLDNGGVKTSSVSRLGWTRLQVPQVHRLPQETNEKLDSHGKVSKVHILSGMSWYHVSQEILGSFC